MAEIDRLSKYYDFDPETTLGPIAETAEWQNRMSYQELADRYHVADATHRVNLNGKLVEYLHLRGEKPDNDSVRLLFAPFGNSALNENIVMRSMRLLASDNPAHLIVASGPAHISNKANLLTRSERGLVKSGLLGPVVNPILEVLGSLEPEIGKKVDILGFSSGATLAQAATVESTHRYYNTKHDLEVDRCVWAEPPNVAVRSLMELAKQFQQSGAELKDYIRQSDSRPLNEAIKLARDDIGYIAGLVRPSNLAISSILTRANFGIKTQRLLADWPNIGITTVVSEHSEVSGTATIDNLEEAGGKELIDKIGVMVLKGAHHAAADDIDLHAAMMMEGLSLADKVRAR